MMESKNKVATWLTLEEVQDYLGVRAQTIYAYVSRGLIASHPDPQNIRRSLYSAETIQKLKQKKQQGRKRETLAANTLFGTEPSIPTAISTFARGRLYYRGKDAVNFAKEATLEETARLLWDAETLNVFSIQERDYPPCPPDRTHAFVALAAATATGHSTHARTARVLHAEAATLVGHLASTFGAENNPSLLIHQRLAKGWGKEKDVADILRKAMVLLADHELTSSAFATRIAASNGASLPACLLTGLATFTGPLHGDATPRVKALLDEVERSSAEQVVNRYLSSALPIPGFGHHLYPDGDPRAIALLEEFEPPDEIAKFIEKVTTLTGLYPNIDAVLAALVTRYRLQGDAAFALFSIARSVGLLAHAMEQINTCKVIRPRGRYIGPDLNVPVNERN
ncbi:citrate synthase family protein [Phytobacter ursingii]|nr:citrate synthase family protein [Phytobacter ursingii]